MRAMIAAAMLLAATGAAHAFCSVPFGLNSEAQSAYEQCQAQERQADALERQNRMLQEQHLEQQHQQRMNETLPPYRSRY